MSAARRARFYCCMLQKCFHRIRQPDPFEAEHKGPGNASGVEHQRRRRRSVGQPAYRFERLDLRLLVPWSSDHIAPSSPFSTPWRFDHRTLHPDKAWAEPKMEGWGRGCSNSCACASEVIGSRAIAPAIRGLPSPAEKEGSVCKKGVAWIAGHLLLVAFVYQGRGGEGEVLQWITAEFRDDWKIFLTYLWHSNRLQQQKGVSGAFRFSVRRTFGFFPRRQLNGGQSVETIETCHEMVILLPRTTN